MAYTQYVKELERYNQYAYRFGLGKIPSSATVAATFGADGLIEGTWVMLNASGAVVPCDGTQRGYMAVSSIRTGRDTLPSTDREDVVVIAGKYLVKTLRYDTTATFTNGGPLKVGTTTKAGLLVPFVPGTDNPNLLVGYTIQKPASSTDYLFFESI